MKNTLLLMVVAISLSLAAQSQSTMRAISSNVVRLDAAEKFDSVDCYDITHYTIQSPGDPDYAAGTSPLKIGRHIFVSGLKPGSGAPVVESQLFLVLDKPLSKGQTYSLHADLKSEAGNTSVLDTVFTFSDELVLGNVKVNQVGYLPQSPKLGKLGNFLGDAWMMPIVPDPPLFEVRDMSGQAVFSGTAQFLKKDADFSGEDVYDLDFSTFSVPGTYQLYVPGYGLSETFQIDSDIYNEPYFHAARALFYQRSSTLNVGNALEWARGGLPQTTAEIHSSHANSPLYSNTDHAPGTQIPMTGGWLDAGDYGRYVPTAASALFILFTAYELYPERFPDDHLNIPQSGNQIPDILDELKYETDWLLQMQAPDGGVYFRVTPANWSQGLPAEELGTLYVSEKTSQSTALFAAAMAMAYRNFKKHFPAYSDICLAASKEAWTFLQAHPQASPQINMPGVNAGPYPDPEDRDNRAWAAAELYKSTGDNIYFTDFQNWYAQIPHHFHATMSWQQHTFKAAWAHATTTFPKDVNVVNEFLQKLGSEVVVNYNTRTLTTHAYHGAYHHFKGYIGYGTFGMAQSYAFDYILFSHILNKPELLEMAKIQLDIPLGNNPLSKVFITGLGKHSPAFPLHWSTVPGKFAKPLPGVPVFGPAASLLMNRPSSFAIQDSANRYPYGYKKEDPYPVLRRYTDARQAVEMAEFTVQEIAVTAAAFAFFSNVVNEALPVRLVSFSGRNVECDVVLEWKTSEEQDADYFAVEQSENGRDFRQIGQVRAAGNSRVESTYSFIDKNPGKPHYYRLLQTDLDGSTTYSRILYVKNWCGGIDILLSQIDRKHFRIQTKSSDEPADVALSGELYGIAGNCLKRFPVQLNGDTEIDASPFPPGLYVIAVLDAHRRKWFTGKLFIP